MSRINNAPTTPKPANKAGGRGRTHPESAHHHAEHFPKDHPGPQAGKVPHIGHGKGHKQTHHEHGTHTPVPMGKNPPPRKRA